MLVARKAFVFNNGDINCFVASISSSLTYSIKFESEGDLETEPSPYPACNSHPKLSRIV